MAAVKVLALSAVVVLMASSMARAETIWSGWDRDGKALAAHDQKSGQTDPGADAFINFGSSGFAESDILTTGGDRPWYESKVVTDLYGHTPDAQERADFTHAVLSHIEDTYHQSGIANFHVTDNPRVAAAHMLSVVSGTEYRENPQAVGITDIGNSGFSFIDKFGHADSIGKLEWAIAHNIAHELMHAFGVDHHDTTGSYLDAASSTWSQLVDSNFKFGPDAVKDLLARDFRTNASGSNLYGAELIGHPQGCPCPLCRRGTVLGAEVTTVAPVPEPAGMALWTLVGSVVVTVRGRRRAA